MAYVRLMGVNFALPHGRTPFITVTNVTSPSKVIWEECVALAQLRNEVPTGYNGTHQIHPKTAIPFDNHHPI